MILTTSSSIAGFHVKETKGLVKGSTIRARHIGRDIVASLRTLIGGEIKEYTAMIAESREGALERMVKNSECLGANAITDVRFSTSMIMSNSSGILTYGTAVVVIPNQ